MKILDNRQEEENKFYERNHVMEKEMSKLRKDLQVHKNVLNELCKFFSVA